MEKDLQDFSNVGVENRSEEAVKKHDNNFDNFQKEAALNTSMWYNCIKSQNDLGCELQAKEGALV